MDVIDSTVWKEVSTYTWYTINEKYYEDALKQKVLYNISKCHSIMRFEFNI